MSKENKEKAAAFLAFREEKQKANGQKTTPTARARQQCEGCGQEKRLSSNNGKNVCPSCVVIRGAARNRPESVFETLREFYGSFVPKLTAIEIQEVISQHCQPSPHLESDAVTGDVRALRVEVDEGKKALQLAQEKEERMAAIISGLRKEAELDNQLAVENQKHVADIVDLRKALEEMTAKYNRAIIEQAHLRAKLENSNGIDKGKLMTIALDLAQYHLDGRIMVNAECFKELRRVTCA